MCAFLVQNVNSKKVNHRFEYAMYFITRWTIAVNRKGFRVAGKDRQKKQADGVHFRAVVGKSSDFRQVFPSFWRHAFLVLNLLLEVLYGVGGVQLQCDGLCQGVHQDDLPPL